MHIYVCLFTFPIVILRVFFFFFLHRTVESQSDASNSNLFLFIYRDNIDPPLYVRTEFLVISCS